MAARSGVMLSVIVRRAPGAQEKSFLDTIQSFLRFLEAGQETAGPVPAQGPAFGSPLAGFDLEASAEYGSHASLAERLKLLGWRLFACRVEPAVEDADNTTALAGRAATADTHAG